MDFSFVDYLPKLITDVKPDAVVNVGDTADMASLCTYDRGTRSFQGRNYTADVTAANEGQDRIYFPLKKRKKKQPFYLGLVGNHDQRINKAIELSPELDGAISLRDLNLEHYNNEVVYYNGSTPGVYCLDGIYYAHYLISGILGRAISGEHPAHSILMKQGASCVVGHQHTIDFCSRVSIDGRRKCAAVAGTFSNHVPAYAGGGSNLWWRGVLVLRGIDGSGYFEPEFISIERLIDVYKN